MLFYRFVYEVPPQYGDNYKHPAETDQRDFLVQNRLVAAVDSQIYQTEPAKTDQRESVNYLYAKRSRENLQISRILLRIPERL